MTKEPTSETSEEPQPSGNTDSDHHSAGLFGRLVTWLRGETTGGILLLVGAVIALIVANSPWGDIYETVRTTYLGVDGVLHLTVQHWAADFLLAFFFLCVGLELKRELVVGQLRDIRQAMMPVIAAAGGVIVPAGLAYLVAFGEPGANSVWPVPVATDIAFALAVLAICARSLPSALRVFLLTLAIADDIGGVALIAVLYSDFLPIPLAVFAITIGFYIFLQQRRFRSVPVYVVLALIAWVSLYQAEVHPTLAAVAVGLATRVRTDEGEEISPAVATEHTISPFSAGVAVPIFAFFSAGVAVNAESMGAFATDRVALSVAIGLFIGKFIGVLGGAWAAVKIFKCRLGEGVKWVDMAAVAILCGCGFTVSLLITELAFADDVAEQELIKIGVLVGSFISAVVSAIMLQLRSSAVRKRQLLERP